MGICSEYYSALSFIVWVWSDCQWGKGGYCETGMIHLLSEPSSSFLIHHESPRNFCLNRRGLEHIAMLTCSNHVPSYWQKCLEPSFIFHSTPPSNSRRETVRFCNTDPSGGIVKPACPGWHWLIVHIFSQPRIQWLHTLKWITVLVFLP